MQERQLLAKIFTHIKPYMSWLLTAMACMMGVAILSAGQAYMVKPLIDEIFFNNDLLMLNILPLALIVLLLVKGLFYYSYSYLLNKVGQSVIKDLRNKLYSHIQSLPLSFFHKNPTGELISRIIADVSLLQGAVSQALVGIVKDLFQIIGLIGVIFFQNWQLALVSLVFLPIAGVPITTFGKKHRRLSIKNQETTAEASNILHETITGTRIVKAFCMENHETRRFAAMIDKLFTIIIKDARVRCLSHPIMELLGGIGVALIIWVGGHQVIHGTSTPGTFFSFLTAFVMIYEPIKSISKVNSTVQKGMAASTRIFTLLDVQADIPEKPDAKPLAPLKKEIAFNDVDFSYDDGTNVLHNINLTVKAGELLAIVGPSGSGKTTLVNLLPRFFDVSRGSIAIDGQDIRDVTLHSLRSEIGMVTQQTILFNDTVRNNIAYGSPDCSERELKDAAKAAHALKFIEQLPQGFDTVIGESGTRLSGGERQRVSIARALLKNAPILILDEATSALDTESEREVQRALENLMKNRTTFVIAHRLSTIRNADRIIVVQKGRIVEEGRHEALLPLDGVYKMLHDMQFQA